jgi:cytochrome c oxidase subunit 5b
VPTDLEQATGLERLEILGKMQGIDIFDMKPLDASRKGTVPKPSRVNHAIFILGTGRGGGEREVQWLTRLN